MRERFPTRQVVPEPSAMRPYPNEHGIRALSAQVDLQSPLPFMRFLKGLDATPRVMSLDEAQALGDVFTTQILLKGNVPVTLRQLDRAIAALVEPAFPVRNMFLIAEGGQSPTQELNDRLVFTWQIDTGSPPDLLLSTVADADNPQALLQLIAWSETGGEFHYFERQRESGFWAWAGSSTHALEAPTRGQGPFDSHVNGSLVMKELKAPWTHWHSMDGSIDRSRFLANSQFNTDPIFASLTGAETLEPMVRQGIRRWTLRRIAARISNGRIEKLPQFMRQVLWATSINLISTPEAFGNATVGTFSLPATFFFDVDGIDFSARKLNNNARVIPSAPLEVDADMYRAAIATVGFRVSDEATPPIRILGDTHFAFLVPERAAEDQEVLRELIRQGIVAPKLALALLMVDFSNPVFSPARAQLLRHTPDSAALGENGKDFEQQFLASIEKASSGVGTPELRFLELLAMPDLVEFCAATLIAYHAAISARLQTTDGIVDILRLADSRRLVCRQKRCLFEFEATLSRSVMPAEHLEMSPLAAVSAKTTDAGEGEL